MYIYILYLRRTVLTHSHSKRNYETIVPRTLILYVFNMFKVRQFSSAQKYLWEFSYQIATTKLDIIIIIFI